MLFYYILGRQLFCCLYQNNLTEERYLVMLQGVISEILDNIPLGYLYSIHFQQDGAPAYV